MRNVSDKSCREKLNIFYVQYTFSISLMVFKVSEQTRCNAYISEFLYSPFTTNCKIFCIILFSQIFVFFPIIGTDNHEYTVDGNLHNQFKHISEIWKNCKFKNVKWEFLNIIGSREFPLWFLPPEI
jgi:hypothetical protein